VEGGVGRAAIAPEILLSLWLYATLDGVGSAREVSRLTEAHDAYRWLCGGVQVNHHTLSDFRKDHGEALDELLSVSIASLMAAGVVKLKQVAQDGMRVRASAGAGSFRRKEKLEGYLEAARTEVARLKAELKPIRPGRNGMPIRSKRSRSGKARSRKRRGHRSMGVTEVAPTGAAAPAPSEGDRQPGSCHEAKEIYKKRAATAECVNAQSRNRGLQQFRRASPANKTGALGLPFSCPWGGGRFTSSDLVLRNPIRPVQQGQRHSRARS
jgi:hypothetical protein